MIRILPVEVRDQEAIDDLCRIQNRRDGTDYAPPRIFSADWGDLEAPKWRQNPNVPMALKVVRDGRLVQAHVFERSLELLTFGDDRRATARSLDELPATLYLLDRQGYEGFHVRVGHGFLAQWERSLRERLRMQRNDDRVAHYYRHFRETE